MSVSVEERLREALAARASGITVTDLQPAAPPSRVDRRAPAFRWPRLVPVLAGAAVAAVAAVAVVLLAWHPFPHPGPRELPGNNAPAATTPAPAPSTGPPLPSPAATPPPKTSPEPTPSASKPPGKTSPSPKSPTRASSAKPSPNPSATTAVPTASPKPAGPTG